MTVQKNNITRMFAISSIIIIAALLLSACGAFTFSGSAQPNADGGITISGGADPATAPQPGANTPAASGTGLSSTTIILLAVGFGVLVLILLILIGRGHGSKTDGPSS